MKLAFLILTTLALSGCVNWAEYSCGGQIKCTPEQMAKVRKPIDWEAEARQLRAEQQARQQHCDSLANDSKIVDPKTEEVIKQSIRLQLKDPESARFSSIIEPGLKSRCHITISTDQNIQIATTVMKDWKYTGLVNAINSYGGYTGDSMFISNGSVGIIVRR